MKLTDHFDTILAPAYKTGSLAFLKYDRDANGKLMLPPTVLDTVFSRSSGGTYAGRGGSLQQAAPDEPRFDWTGGKPIVLMEPSRTNLMPHSEDLSHSDWRFINVDVDAAINFPNGNSSFKLIENSTSITYFNLYYTFPTQDIGYYTFSFWSKKAERNFVGAEIYTNNGDRYTAIVDLNNGEVTDTDITGAPSNIKAVVEEKHDGWYKISITSEQTESSILYGFLMLSDSANPVYSVNRPQYAGVIGSGAYFSRVQLEQGSYSTSYIPTSGNIATRATENISFDNLSGKNVTGNDYTIHADMVQPNSMALGDYSLCVYDTNQDLVFAVWGIANNEYTIRSFANGIGAYVNPSGKFTGKFILRVTNGILDVFSNGIKIISLSNHSLNNANQCDRLDFNSSDANLIKGLAISPRALSDADCITLTSPE